VDPFFGSRSCSPAQALPALRPPGVDSALTHAHAHSVRVRYADLPLLARACELALIAFRQTLDRVRNGGARPSRSRVSRQLAAIAQSTTGNRGSRHASRCHPVAIHRFVEPAGSNVVGQDPQGCAAKPGTHKPRTCGLHQGPSGSRTPTIGVDIDRRNLPVSGSIGVTRRRSVREPK